MRVVTGCTGRVAALEQPGQRTRAPGGSSTGPMRSSATSRTTSRRATRIACERARADARSQPRSSATRAKASVSHRHGHGGSAATHAGPASAAVSRGRVCALGVCAAPARRRGLCRPGHPGARRAACRDGIALVGLGPRTNFRVRRWRDRLREFVNPQPQRRRGHASDRRLSAWRTLAPSRAVWRARAATFATLSRSADLRAAAVIGGYDLWPLLEDQWRGVADLQFPWSARAMDEAGAALDALRPEVALTYAEAGGWGRALMLEARRRGIATVARCSTASSTATGSTTCTSPTRWRRRRPTRPTAGFPRPDCTLIFDEFTREHLEAARALSRPRACGHGQRAAGRAS